MQTVIETIGANSVMKLPCDGTFFQLLECAFPLDLSFLMMGMGAADGNSLGVTSGFYHRTSGADRMLTVVVKNTSATAQQFKYIYGEGVAGYERLMLTLAQATAVEHGVLTLTTATELYLPGDAARRRLICTAHPDNVGNVYLGGTPLLDIDNAARRLAADDGWSDEIAAGAPLYAFADNAGDRVCVEIAK